MCRSGLLETVAANRCLLFTLAVALVVRMVLAVVIQHRVDQPPSRLCLIAGDAEGYWELAQHIVATIAPQLQKAEISRIAQKRPENFSAYDCFLRGLELVYQLDRKRFDSAKDMFARAIQLDPGYASPYAYSALWHAVRIGQGWSTDAVADQAAVTDLAAAALERDRLDEIGRAHV